MQSLRMHSQKGFSFRDLSELWLRVKQTDDCLTLSLFDPPPHTFACEARMSSRRIGKGLTIRSGSPIGLQFDEKSS